MATSLVKEASKTDVTHATLVYESDLTQYPLAISELSHADTRKQAMSEAAGLGIVSPRCGMPAHPYPVDIAGNLVADGRTQKIHRYRIDIPIISGVMG